MEKEKRIALISTSGLGDSLNSFVIAKLLRQKGIESTVFCAVRPEIWTIIENLFKTYNPIHLSPDLAESNNLFRALEGDFDKEINHIKDCYGNIFVCYPDEMFSSKYAFPYAKYNISLQRIKETRLLVNQWNPSDTIYVGLNSSTPEYQLHDPEEIVKEIALSNKEKSIYFPIVTEWAGHQLNYFDESKWKDLPDNVIIQKNPDFLQSINFLKECCYFAGVDNGISHLAHSLGMPRLLLDSRMSQPPFIARWRYSGLFDSVDQNIHPSIIGKIVKANLEVPQTQLIPRDYVRQFVTNYNEPNWKSILILKDFNV